MKSKTDILLNKALTKLNNDRENLQNLLSEHEGTDIGCFLHRILEWYSDETRQHLLYGLFSEVINMSDIGFMGSLYSFVCAELIDDGGFRIIKRHNHYVVVYDCDGHQDPSLLMKAMDDAEQNFQRLKTLESNRTAADKQ